MKIKKLLIAGSATACFLSHSALGATISVNYDIAGGNTVSLQSTDVAGVVPVSNWNNVQASGVGQNFNYGITYIDDSGANTTLIVAASSGTADTWNTGGTPDEIIFGDKSNWAGGTQTLTLSGIGYATYDLYIYSSEWSNEVVNFSIGANFQTLTNTFTPQFNSVADPDLVLNNTYVKFSGLSGDSIVSMSVSSGGLHLGGFQIVEVPEPSSSFLIGLAWMGLLGRRRRG